MPGLSLSIWIPTVRVLENFWAQFGKTGKKETSIPGKEQWQTPCGCPAIGKWFLITLMSHITFQPFICELHQILIERRYVGI